MPTQLATELTPEERLPYRERALPVLKEASLYASAFLAALVCFLLFKPYYEVSGTQGIAAQSFAALLLGGCVLLVAYLKLSGKLTPGRLTALLLFAGFALRLCYMLSTPASWRQHDTYTGRGDGHEGYAWTLFTTGRLPATNDYQFYHPPLNAFLQAGFMRFMSGFGIAPDAFLFGKPEYIEAERYFLYSSCQILSLLYSFAVCVVSLKILKILGVKGPAYAALSAFLIFYPRGIHFAASLNNDGVAYLCSMLALFFALKWWKKGKGFADILLCGVATGLGMAAKLSSATVCLPIAGVFIYEFAHSVGRKEGALSMRAMFGQYAAFLAVCTPLGLWFQVYAQARFGQPFGFVFSNLNHKLYTGDRSLFERFSPIVFDANEYFGSLWCRTFEFNYNLFHFSLRSSIFGEQSYARGDGFALTAVVFAYLSVIFLLISLVRAAYLFCKHDLKKKDERTRENKRNVFFIFLLVFSQVFSEIYFYVQMPYGCTMDFRYIMPLILGMGLTLWLTLSRLKEEGGKLSVALSRLTAVSVGVFLLFSVLFYMICV